MKKNILLLVAASLMHCTALFALGEVALGIIIGYGDPVEGYGYGYHGYPEILDSVITLDAAGNKVSKMEHGADDSEAYYTWSSVLNRWIGETKTLSVSENGQTTTINYAWSIALNKWLETSKTESSSSYENENNNHYMQADYSWSIALGKWIGGSKHEQISDDAGGTNIYYKWNSIQDDWVIESGSKYENVFDEDGSVTHTMHYDWNSLSDSWDYQNYYYSDKYENTYDDKGRVILRLRYSWNGGEWVQSYATVSGYYYTNEYWKEEHTYDERGNQTSFTFVHDYVACAICPPGSFPTKGRYEQIYDKDNNEICYIYSIGENGETDSWVEQSKVEAVYENNRPVLEMSYTKSGNSWVLQSKVERAYYPNGNEALVILSQCDGYNVCKVVAKEEYDIDGRPTYYYSESEYTDYWNIYPRSKTETSFSGNTMTDTYYEWDNQKNDWKMTSRNKQVFTFDSNGIVIMQTNYEWVNGSFVLVNHKLYYHQGVSMPDVNIPAGSGIVVIPSEEDALIAWQTNENATGYQLVIYKGAEEVCTLLFNASGQLISVVVQAAKSKVSSAVPDKMAFTVNGLTAGTTYSYTLTVFDAENNVIDQKNGHFTTANENTGINDVAETQQVVPLRVAGYYSVLGQRLPQEPQNGVYIILYDNGTAVKVIK